LKSKEFDFKNRAAALFFTRDLQLMFLDKIWMIYLTFGQQT